MPDPVANRETRCELCYYTVWPQFSWCEAPCERSGTWAKGRWQICGTCGAMRCDPAPGMLERDEEGNPVDPPRPPPSLQHCMCTFPAGPACWGDKQRVAKERWQRVTWCR
jgi:hypothetical protein